MAAGQVFVADNGPSDLEIAHKAYTASEIDIRYAHLALALSDSADITRRPPTTAHGEYSRANAGCRAGDTSYQDHFSLPHVILSCVNRLNIFDVEILELSNSKLRS
jgi:hypothetical protein